MNILLVNNNTRHIKDLRRSLAGHDIEMVNYMPGASFPWEDKDMVILSGGGGEGLEINDFFFPGKLWYEDEMKFVARCNKPIVGICMGFEIIARAYGSSVVEMPKLVTGYLPSRVTEAGRRFIDTDEITQFEAHKWHVEDIHEDFEVLAQSPTGIEIIRHKTRPIIATQFHPEKLEGTLSLKEIIKLNFQMEKQMAKA